MIQPLQIAASVVPVSIHVHAQTLYTVSPDISASNTAQVSEVVAASQTISSIGVGADGWTTFVEEGVITSAVEVEPSTTRTIVANPASFSFTFEPAASGFRQSIPGSLIPKLTDVVTCTFGAHGRGKCVEGIGDAQITHKTTVWGDVVPFYTLQSAQTTRTSLTISPTTSSPSVSHNGGTFNAIPSLYLCLWLSLLGGAVLHVV